MFDIGWSQDWVMLYVKLYLIFQKDYLLIYRKHDRQRKRKMRRSEFKSFYTHLRRLLLSSWGKSTKPNHEIKPFPLLFFSWKSTCCGGQWMLVSSPLLYLICWRSSSPDYEWFENTKLLLGLWSQYSKLKYIFS